MMKKLTILVMLALLLAACGTTTNQTDDGNNNSAINQATAVEAIEVTEEPTQAGGEDVENDLLFDDDLDLGLPSDFMPMPAMENFLDVFDSPISEWDCSESTVSGDATDADDDGIAVNATYDIKCTKSFASLPMIGDVITVERTGTLTMKDADDDDPTSGYTATGDITFKYLEESFTTEHQFSRNWTGNATSGYSYQHSDAWTWTAGDMSYKVEHSHTGSYTPDEGVSNPFDAGQLQEEGKVSHYIDGDLACEVSESADVHLNKTCSPAADDGEITFSWKVGDEDGAAVSSETVVFTGCGEYHLK